MSTSPQLAPLTRNSVPPLWIRLQSPHQTAVLALLVALVSYVAAWLGHSIVLSSRGVSVLWPACAFLVAVLLLVPRRTWPVLIPAGIAGFVVHDVQIGFTLGTIVLLNLADTIEVLIVCLGLGFVFGGVPRLNGSKALVKYCFFAVLLGPFVSAFVVALAIEGSYILNWRIWFFSQALAFLTVTPAILSWPSVKDGSGFRGSLHSQVEAAALVAGLAVLGFFVLLAPSKTLPLALIYSFVPFLLWAALRFGSMGVSTSMIVISFLSIWGAIHGRGPFAGPEPFNDVLSLQLFLIFAALPFMALAVMAEERDRHEQALSSVNRRLIEAHEEERTWIARELHDDFSQRVALVSLSIDRLEQALPGSELRARAYTEELKEQLRELGNDIHALSHRLHSSKLQFLGLAAACKGFCRELSERQSVEIEFCSEGIPADLPSEISLSLFRVLQEALQNAVKHSGVRTFFVSLVSASNEIELCVRDSGTGFDPERAASEHGLGLTSMKERLNLVDGRFSIDSKVGQGTTIKAWVSLTQQANPRSNSKVASAVTTSAPSES